MSWTENAYFESLFKWNFLLFIFIYIYFLYDVFHFCCITLTWCIVACCVAEKQQSKSKPAAMQNGGGSISDPASSSPSPKLEPTWIHQIFQGTFTSETRCLNCETVFIICLDLLHFLLRSFCYCYISDWQWNCIQGTSNCFGWGTKLDALDQSVPSCLIKELIWVTGRFQC